MLREGNCIHYPKKASLERADLNWILENWIIGWSHGLQPITVPDVSGSASVHQEKRVAFTYISRSIYPTSSFQVSISMQPLNVLTSLFYVTYALNERLGSKYDIWAGLLRILKSNPRTCYLLYIQRITGSHLTPVLKRSMQTTLWSNLSVSCFHSNALSVARVERSEEVLRCGKRRRISSALLVMHQQDVCSRFQSEAQVSQLDHQLH